jgi:hypothetical protein
MHVLCSLTGATLLNFLHLILWQAKMSVKEFFDGEENRPRGKGGKYGSNTEVVKQQCRLYASL